MRKLTVFLFLLTSHLFASWNDEFDEQSRVMIQNFADFQAEDYLAPYSFFSNIRADILQDLSFEQKMRNSLESDKFEIINLKKGVIFKKRRVDNINEVFVWELSCLLGGSEFVVPSFPIEVASKKIVVQRLESFIIADRTIKIPPIKALRTISLETYWKAHILAYILAFKDLVGRNIGVDSLGKIRFFDNEDSLDYHNKSFREGASLVPPFVSQSFDWPHYRMPLNEKGQREIKRFIERILSAEEAVKSYITDRSCELLEEGLMERFANLKAFPLHTGSSFRELFAFLFPKMNPGLGELNNLVRSILKKEVDHGSSLLFLKGRARFKGISAKQLAKLTQWMDSYGD